MSAPPYMRVYVADYTADVQHLTCEQDGAYWRLIRAMWRGGGKLPNTPAKLATICGLSAERWTEIGADVLALFTIRGGSITHKRVASERRSYDAKILQAQQAGKASAEKRRNKNNANGSTVVAISLQRKVNQPEPELERKRKTPSVSKEKGFRLPDSWALSEADKSYARQAGVVEVDEMGEAFADYWRQQPGQRGRKLDWSLTWKTWVRNDRSRTHRPAEARAAWT